MRVFLLTLLLIVIVHVVRSQDRNNGRGAHRQANLPPTATKRGSRPDGLDGRAAFQRFVNANGGRQGWANTGSHSGGSGGWRQMYNSQSQYNPYRSFNTFNVDRPISHPAVLERPKKKGVSIPSSRPAVRKKKQRKNRGDKQRKQQSPPRLQKEISTPSNDQPPASESQYLPNKAANKDVNKDVNMPFASATSRGSAHAKPSNQADVATSVTKPSGPTNRQTTVNKAPPRKAVKTSQVNAPPRKNLVTEAPTVATTKRMSMAESFSRLHAAWQAFQAKTAKTKTTTGSKNNNAAKALTTKKVVQVTQKPVKSAAQETTVVMKTKPLIKATQVLPQMTQVKLNGNAFRPDSAGNTKNKTIVLSAGSAAPQKHASKNNNIIKESKKHTGNNKISTFKNNTIQNVITNKATEKGNVTRPHIATAHGGSNRERPTSQTFTRFKVIGSGRTGSIQSQPIPVLPVKPHPPVLPIPVLPVKPHPPVLTRGEVRSRSSSLSKNTDSKVNEVGGPRHGLSGTYSSFSEYAVPQGSQGTAQTRTFGTGKVGETNRPNLVNAIQSGQEGASSFTGEYRSTSNQDKLVKGNTEATAGLGAVTAFKPRYATGNIASSDLSFGSAMPPSPKTKTVLLSGWSATSEDSSPVTGSTSQLSDKASYTSVSGYQASSSASETYSSGSQTDGSTQQTSEILSKVSRTASQTSGSMSEGSSPTYKVSGVLQKGGTVSKPSLIPGSPSYASSISLKTSGSSLPGHISHAHGSQLSGSTSGTHGSTPHVSKSTSITHGKSKSIVSGSSSNVIGSFSQVPVTKSQVSKTQVSGSSSYLPGSSSQIPGSSLQVPGSKSQVSRSMPHASGQSSFVPGSSSQVHGSKSQVSKSTPPEVSKSTSQVPGSSSQIPGSKSQVSISTRQVSKSMSQVSKSTSGSAATLKTSQASESSPQGTGSMPKGSVLSLRKSSSALKPTVPKSKPAANTPKAASTSTKMSGGPIKRPCKLAPICGTDGFTYMSPCFLVVGVKKACSGFCPCRAPVKTTPKPRPSPKKPSNVPTKPKMPPPSQPTPRPLSRLRPSPKKPSNVPTKPKMPPPSQPTPRPLSRPPSLRRRPTGLKPAPTSRNSGFGRGPTMPDVTTPGCVCSQQYEPVCGINGQTYGNDCERRCDYVGLKCQGTCPCGGARPRHTPLDASRPKTTKLFNRHGNTLVEPNKVIINGNSASRSRGSSLNPALEIPGRNNNQAALVGADSPNAPASSVNKGVGVNDSNPPYTLNGNSNVGLVDRGIDSFVIPRTASPESTVKGSGTKATASANGSTDTASQINNVASPTEIRSIASVKETSKSIGKLKAVKGKTNQTHTGSTDNKGITPKTPETTATTKTPTPKKESPKQRRMRQRKRQIRRKNKKANAKPKPKPAKPEIEPLEKEVVDREAMVTSTPVGQTPATALQNSLSWLMFDSTGFACLCPYEYLPICGTNGITYNNYCSLTCDGIPEHCPGECPCQAKPATEPAPTSGGIVPTSGNNAHQPYTCADYCPTHHSPVCSTRGHTFDNECIRDCSGEPFDCYGSCPCPREVYNNNHGNNNQPPAHAPTYRVHPDPYTGYDVNVYPDVNNEPSNQQVSTCNCRPGDVDPICTTDGRTLWYGCLEICRGAIMACSSECPC